jgi:hypothetical protein
MNSAWALPLGLTYVLQASEASDKALQEAILAFPQVVLILADKAGFSIDQKVRECSAFDMEVAYR